METAVLRDPISEGVDADVAERVAVHVVEDARGVQLELVTFIIDLIFSLDDQAKESGQLLEPSPLEEVLLLNTEVVGDIGASAGSARLDGHDPFVELDSAIVVGINNLN